jgi:subtilase family serine protease
MFRRLGIITIAILAILSLANNLSQAQSQSVLTRHVRQVILDGEAQYVSRLAATQSIHFDVVLPLRDRGGLENFLEELRDPASPLFHQFLTPQEFTARFGPSQEDWNALVAFAKANGFEIVSGSRDAMDLRLIGTVANIEQAFHLTMGIYQDISESRTFYSPDREPTTNLPFPLWHISGLDNYSIPHPKFLRKGDYAKARGIDPETVVSHATTGSGPSASFLGSDMRAAYYQGTALTGTGQNIGLFEYEGYDIADLNTYYTNVGQTRTATVTGISTDGTSLTCLDSGHPKCDDTEQIIDMTQALGMAPGITALYVYVGSTDTAIISAMTVTTDAPLSLQLSCSWGWSPADPSTLDPYFEKMASQGQNFFAASGDDSTWCSSQSAKCFPWPADDANIVSVGGTDLTTTSAAGPWASETAWADSGGGISPDSIPIPSWQQLSGVINSSNKGSTTLRNGPDVSANANFTFYTCADQKACEANEYGGTSFAAPMWAGYLALANQQAATTGESIGFLDPIIYPAALTSSYGTLFHDITSGTSGSYSAVIGYDLVTGWGSPNTTGLINLLAPATPGIYSPANDSTLTATSATFEWHAYAGATAYWLDVGSTAGGNNYYSSGSLSTSTLSETVTTLPSNGSTVYATWYYLLNGSWVPTDYTYTAFGGASSKGVITSPVPGSTLTGSSVAFTWTAGSAATAYWIDVGSTSSGNNYYSSGNLGNVLTKTVAGLPTNGSPVYVTLYSLVSGQWIGNAYNYTASSSSTAEAVLTTPTPGSTLINSTVTFDWTAGSPGPYSYWLDIGSSAGGNNYYSSGNLGNVTSTTASGLPTNGSTVYVTLYTLIGGTWYGNGYTYTGWNGTSGLAAMQTPTPGTTLSGTTATFTWSSDASASGYWVDIGSTAGGNDVYSSGNLGTTLTTTVYTLPANGNTIYVSLYSYVGGQWLNDPVTYVSGP